MKDISYLKSLHDEIFAYTKAHDDLSESHHWLFDLPPFKDEPLNPKHIVFGINPGEGKERLCLTQTEETRFFDCHEEYRGKGAREKIGWTKKLLNILETRKIIQTELFLRIYFFRGTRYIRVNPANSWNVDGGYPRDINVNWRMAFPTT